MIPNPRLSQFTAVFLLAFAAAMLPAGEDSPDWPQFRGAGGLGVSPEKGLPVTWSREENILWKTALPGPGASSPIIVGSRVYVTSSSGHGKSGPESGGMEGLRRHLVCVDAAAGGILWSKSVAAKLPEPEKIREDHGYASSTPAADGQRIYVFFGKTGVLAFDRDGNEKWRADVGSNTSGWGSAASPVIHEDLLIVNASVESESLVALDRGTGKERWRASGIKESWNTPILVAVEGGKTELVVAIIGKVLGIDPTSGEKLWSCDTGIGWYMVPSAVARDGVVYCIGGRSGGALAVRAGGRGDVTGSRRLWTGNKGSNVSSPILHEGHLYWMHENLGIAYCADAGTGKIAYEHRIEGAGQVYASPVMAGGRIIYVTRSGRAYVVAARPEFEQLAANDLGDRAAFNASPAVSGGRLFLRSDRFLYCIGKKPEKN